jgi:hypothetical protein
MPSGYFAVTGGDDQSISACTFDVDVHVGGDDDAAVVDIRTNMLNDDLHNSCVTGLPSFLYYYYLILKFTVALIDGSLFVFLDAGIWSDGEWIVSASVDQRLNIYKLCNVGDERTLASTLCASTMLEVADISGMVVTKIPTDKQNANNSDGEAMLIITNVGQGLQSITVNLPP